MIGLIRWNGHNFPYWMLMVGSNALYSILMNQSVIARIPLKNTTNNNLSQTATTILHWSATLSSLSWALILSPAFHTSMKIFSRDSTSLSNPSTSASLLVWSWLFEWAPFNNMLSSSLLRLLISVEFVSLWKVRSFTYWKEVPYTENR